MKLFPLSSALQNMLLYGSSIVLMKGVSLFMLPYIANHIPQHELGRLELLSIIAMIFSVILGLSLWEALYRFVGAEPTADKKQKITGEIFTLTMIVAVISLPLIWLVNPIISELKPEYASTTELNLLLLPLAFEGLVAVVLASFRMQEKAKLFFYLTTGRALVQTVLTIIVLQQGHGLTAILMAGFISATLQIIALIYLQGKQNKKVNGSIFIFNKDIAKLSIPYCIPLMASGLVSFGLNGFERWVLAENTSFSEVALYAVALKFSLALILLMQPFAMWWMPNRFNYLQSHGKTSTVKITQSSIVLLCGLTVLVCFFAPVLIEYLMPTNYSGAKTIATALIIATALRELTELINLGALVEKQTKKLLIINSSATTVGMISILVLTPIYNVNGVLASLILAQSIRVIFTFIVSQRAYSFGYSKRKLSILFSVTAASIVLSISSFSISTHFIIATLCVVAVIILASQLQLITLPEYEKVKNAHE